MVAAIAMENERRMGINDLRKRMDVRVVTLVSSINRDVEKAYKELFFLRRII